MNIKIYILLVFYVILNYSEAEEKCRFSRCNECISSTDDCIWCSQKQMTNEQSTRCMPNGYQNVSRTWCDKENIQSSKPVVHAPKNRQFSKTVQLQPDRIKIKARPGFISPFEFYYQPAKDSPLDVYFLIDISFTMTSKLHELKGQADQIYTQLTTYSNNVRLGIGSFVEKPGFPYVDKHKSESPHRAHAFKHHLSLTSNTNEFKSTIDNIQFGANYDDPEAGLDGLMQAMTCLDELGWRNNTRRIIVLCTDSTYHSAGDGKIVGAIKPNDMKCHLKNNEYDEKLALTYDYPSVSQINKMAIEGQFTIVFAAASSASEVYKKLASQIKGAKYSNLERGTEAVEIIKEAYRINAIEPSLTFEQWPHFLEMTYNCGNKKCESTPDNRTVKIKGYLTIKQCPADKKYKRQHSFGVHGIPDKLTIELDIDCECDCEKTPGEMDPICKNGGLLQCGICNCVNPASYGINCQCSSTETDTKHDDQCKHMETDNKYCSGNGICECGKCSKCTDGYSGDYCEYNNDACPKKGGILCSGKGKCERGKCWCDPHWTSPDCSCSLITDTCMAPYSKNVCSDNGICICGKCECAANGTYSGTYCDVCDDCAEKRCKELEDYVHCNFVNETKLCNELYNATDTTVVTFKNETELNELEWNMAQLCEIQLKNKSKIIFKYQYDDAKLVLGIQKGLVSPPEVNLFVAVGSAIGAVLLIGILTLIVWKILIDLHDKREYEKFSEESKAAGYDVTFNPLFIEAEVSFANPTFDRGA